MSSTIEAEERIRVGEAVVIGSRSPFTQFEVVFEDDSETGYLYGLDHSREVNPIVDALHIYNVKDVVDREKPSVLQIMWSGDGLKAALWINGFPHAVFDFAATRSYCRTNFPNFPNSGSEWSKFSKEWSDAAMELF